MRKMKKALAVVLAATMTMSMGMTALAASYDKNGNVITQPDPEGDDPQFFDVETVDLNKLYTAINSNTTSPEETFKFTISAHGVKDSQYTVSDVPVPSFSATDPDDHEGTISFRIGDATTAGMLGDTKLYLPRYDYVGIFTYKIEENVGISAGVKYSGSENTEEAGKPMYLKVTVVEQEGKVRVAALHYETENADKTTANFQNEYSAGSLAVKKTVTGNMGDQKLDFTVTVTFTAPEGKYVNAPIYFDDDLEDGDELKEITGNWTGTKKQEITLKHDETVNFTNIPYGVTYTVVEDDYTKNSDGTDNYDAAKYSLNSGEATTKSVSNEKLDQANESVEIINNKGTVVDTGVILDSMPYMALLAMVALGMGAVVLRKRDEDLF